MNAGNDQATSRTFANVSEQPGIAKALRAEREGFRSAVGRVENSLVEPLRGVQPGVTAGVTPSRIRLHSSCGTRRNASTWVWSEKWKSRLITQVSEVGGASPRSQRGDGATSRDA